jgi:hypothetical protein
MRMGSGCAAVNGSGTNSAAAGCKAKAFMAARNVPLRASSTQRRSKLALSPRANATPDKEAPGTWLARTAASLNSTLYVRRRLTFS